jgi:transaldolase
MMTKLQQLADLGQSIWYDHIRRALFDSGELRALVDVGVTGVTSNPSIFEKAIAGSADYDQALGKLVSLDKSEDDIFEALADEQALEDAGRRVIRFHLGTDVVGELKELMEGLA